MSEPTLEQIAAQMPDSPFYCAVNQAVLAREIIALREAHVYLATYVGVSEESARDGLEGHRQDALESRARPFQESGELAVGREGDPHLLSDRLLIGAAAKRAIDAAHRERDSFEVRLAEMTDERDMQMDRGNIANQYVTHVVAERDAAREALRKIVDGSGFDAVTIAQAALDGSGQHE